VLVEEPQVIDATVGLGGPAIIEFSKNGFPNASYALSLLSLTNVDTPYLFVQYGVPRIENDTGIIPGERLDMQTNLRGSPDVGGVDWASLDPILNLDGVFTSSGFAYDFNTQGFASLNFDLEIYPELKRLLEENPRFLLDLTDLELESLQFDFYIFAAVTPMTSAEYVEFQNQRASELRDAVLADPEAPALARQAVADLADFQSFYLASLVEAGVLRPEDLPPSATRITEFNSDLALMLAGLLGDSGATEADIETYFSRIRAWAGETPNAYGGSAPPDRSQYALDTESPTRFEAFTIEVKVPDEFFAISGFGSQGSGQGPDETDLGSLFEEDAEQSPSLRFSGPSGFGEFNTIPVGYDLPFILNFANPSAGDSIRELRIVQQLDPALDVRSFRLGPIEIGDTTLDIAQNRGSFDGEFDFTDTLGYRLQVSAGVDIVERVATWTFRAIDPETGLLVPVGENGVLQPGESATLSFIVKPLESVASGTEVRTRMRAFVDGDAPIESNEVLATIDSVAPVTDLNISKSPAGVYTLDWTAQDDSLGSGVRHFSIFVSGDGLRYSALDLRTTDTRYTFDGSPGSELVFLVLATDNAGNIEAAPEGARLPIFNPGINLGALPQAPPTSLLPFTAASPPSAAISNALFAELIGQIPGQLSGLQLPSYNRIFDPFAASSFARGIDGSNANVGVIGLALDLDGRLWVSGGQGRNELHRLEAGGSPSSEPLVTLDTPIYSLAFDREGNFGPLEVGDSSC